MDVFREYGEARNARWYSGREAGGASAMAKNGGSINVDAGRACGREGEPRAPASRQNNEWN